MGQSQSWLNNGNVFVNIYSVKILPKFTILLIMNYLIGSRRNSNRIPFCQQVLCMHSTPSAVTAEMRSACQSPRKDSALLLSAESKIHSTDRTTQSGMDCVRPMGRVGHTNGYAGDRDTPHQHARTEAPCTNKWMHMGYLLARGSVSSSV